MNYDQNLFVYWNRLNKQIDLGHYTVININHSQYQREVFCNCLFKRYTCMYVKPIEYSTLHEVHETRVDRVTEVDLCDLEIHFESNTNEKKNTKE